jgi:peptidoglycan/LPS O-acetylase OafA/YrhL
MKRIPQLDGLRALAFLAVYLNHSLQVPFFWAGVDLFFVLSGFLITGLLLSEAEEMQLPELLRGFYTRRAFRILIPYCALMAAVTIFVDRGWVAFWPYYVFFSQNFAVAFHSADQGIFTPLWSLAVEEQFYLVWPLLIFFTRRRGLGPLCWALILAAAAMRIIVAGPALPYTATFSLMPFRMDLLAAGALIAIASRRSGTELDAWRPAAFYTLAGSAAAFAILAATKASFRAKTNSLLFNGVGYPLILIACVSILIIALTANTGVIYWLLTLRPIRYLGRISFMLYMAHEPVMHAMKYRGGVLDAAISLAAVTAFATITWYAFEERCIRKARQLTMRQRSPSTRNEAVVAPG